MKDSSRTRVTGPLQQYASGFRVELIGAGFRPGSTSAQLALMADASRWLASEGLDAGAFSAAQVKRFGQARRAAGCSSFVSGRALACRSPLLGYLRGLGVVPDGDEPPVSAVEALIERYRVYLLVERGLVPGTVIGYVEMARPFLVTRLDSSGQLDLEGLTGGEVLAFVLAECQRRRRRSAQLMATSLRSLLRFLHVQGLTTRPLAQVVPAIPNWRLAGLPRALEPEQLAALLSSCDRATAVGSRNYAVLVLLARLGMRRCEVAALQLDDIDWRASEIIVRGKGMRVEALPLPSDVGQALAEYLRHGRPSSAQGRAVFVRVMPAHRALTPHGITEVVISAGRRAGLGEITAHRLRHTAARELLRAGAPLSEIGQLLRHRSQLTTAIYAKVDRERLRELARPWPGGLA
jgi:site-specific recombinase XerD